MCVCVCVCVCECVCVRARVRVFVCMMGVAFNGREPKSKNYQAGTKDNKKVSLGVCEQMNVQHTRHNTT